MPSVPSRCPACGVFDALILHERNDQVECTNCRYSASLEAVDDR